MTNLTMKVIQQFKAEHKTWQKADYIRFVSNAKLALGDAGYSQISEPFYLYAVQRGWEKPPR